MRVSSIVRRASMIASATYIAFLVLFSFDTLEQGLSLAFFYPQRTSYGPGVRHPRFLYVAARRLVELLCCSALVWGDGCPPRSLFSPHLVDGFVVCASGLAGALYRHPLLAGLARAVG